MEGSVPFYQNPTSGDTATTVCILFGLVAALGGLGSAVLNFKDTSGAGENSSSPEVSGIKSRVKHFDEEVKSERTPLAGIATASRTEENSEFNDNVNTFVRGVAHGDTVIPIALSPLPSNPPSHILLHPSYAPSTLPLRTF